MSETEKRVNSSVDVLHRLGAILAAISGCSVTWKGGFLYVHQVAGVPGQELPVRVRESRTTDGGHRPRPSGLVHVAICSNYRTIWHAQRKEWSDELLGEYAREIWRVFCEERERKAREEAVRGWEGVARGLREYFAGADYKLEGVPTGLRLTITSTDPDKMRELLRFYRRQSGQAVGKERREG